MGDGDGADTRSQHNVGSGALRHGHERGSNRNSVSGIDRLSLPLYNGVTIAGKDGIKGSMEISCGCDDGRVLSNDNARATGKV